MNLQELKTLLAIVETGSLVRASTVLNVTQSTVTARLQSLEDDVGQTLINRNRSGATLTAAGIKLLRYADTIANLWQQAKQEMTLPQGMSGFCNIACEYDLWPNLGNRFFETLHKTNPEIVISVWKGSQTDVASWLDAGTSDLAITYRSTVSQRQGQIKLAPDALILVSTTAETSTHFNADYVYIEAGHTFGRDHAAAYANAGTARLSFGNAETGLAYLMKHGGNAYLPRRMVQGALDDGRLYQVEDAQSFARATYLTYNKAARAAWGWFDDVVAALN